MNNERMTVSRNKREGWYAGRTRSTIIDDKMTKNWGSVLFIRRIDIKHHRRTKYDTNRLHHAKLPF